MTVPNHTVRPIARATGEGDVRRYGSAGSCAKRDGGRFGAAVIRPRTTSDLVAA
ncbi:hypothetical protein [Halegenticoccus tardaugens]|uniref:hypothetical protein n=1 Tax=Halegenticoccus tardaugens TaxID=2071624 RepID=UPI0013E90299|nr:hypothetical protein [Halegenticoccus tardaugens]